jgi:response regulator RpfG family c-di-GMP phosphodiesterase
VYKAALKHEEVVRIIEDESGHHFDPAVVSAFLTINQRFAEIARDYAD